MVKLVGMIVGVDEFDNMTRYKGMSYPFILRITSYRNVIVDDGTALIDCDMKHPKNVKSDSPKSKSKYRKAAEKPKVSYSKPPTLPVGTSICVKGRIVRGRGSRFLRTEADSLSAYPSFLLRRFYLMTPQPFAAL